MVNFIGRFHPAVLHLPIGFFVLLGIFEFLAMVSPGSRYSEVTSAILVLTILVTLLAIGTGLLLAYGEGADEPLVVNHMRTSLLLGILSLCLGMLKLHGSKLANILAYRLGLLVTLGVLFVASHNGGSITHGEDYLTRYMPDSLRPFFGREVEEAVVVASVDELVVYRDVVHQVFEQKCNSCHNPNKKKGDFDMTTYEGLLEGGEMGYSIAPGDLDDSELYFRITLPQDDEDFMPADEKPPLSEVEVQLIGWWIEEGADPEKTVSQHSNIPAPVYTYLQSVFDSMVSEEELEAREQERQELYDGLEALHEELGILIVPVEPDAMEFTLETFSVQKQFDAAGLARLAAYGEYFVSADLSGTQLGDDAVGHLTAFRNLESLNLSKTRITGTSLGKLADLPHLRSLNLYGTPLTEDAVAELSKLSRLKHLYLFQTSLDEEATLAQLKGSLPDCKFVTGI